MPRLTPSAAALASDDGTALSLARSRLTLPAAVRGLRLAGWDRMGLRLALRWRGTRSDYALGRQLYALRRCGGTNMIVYTGSKQTGLEGRLLRS